MVSHSIPWMTVLWANGIPVYVCCLGCLSLLHEMFQDTPSGACLLHKFSSQTRIACSGVLTQIPRPQGQHHFQRLQQQVLICWLSRLAVRFKLGFCGGNPRIGGCSMGLRLYRVVLSQGMTVCVPWSSPLLWSEIGYGMG